MSSRRPEEITSILKEKIENYTSVVASEELGRVIQVGDGIARIYGLQGARYGEMLLFEGGVTGMVQSLEEENVGAIIFSNTGQIIEGSTVKRTGKIMEIPVGESMIGRVVDPLGNPLDGKGAITTNRTRRIENKPEGVMGRKSVHEPLQTGIKAIDALVPIGRGQRELIIGDRQTGKTSIAIDTILNQHDQNMICIYVAIGQKESTVSNVVRTLKARGAMDYSIVISASASQPSPLQYIAPYAGVTIAEDFMYEGKHVLIIYDDLTKHAVAYRELSLLLRRPPGREAFPGDVFYLHSRLLERSAKLSDELGGGSITALPFIETQASNEAAYIPTNVISITDGQIFLKSELFYSGVRPAVDAGLSVSRVGGAAQTKAMKKVSGTLRLDLASFRELEAFSQFASDLDDATKAKLERGKRTVEVLKQPINSPVSMEKQVMILRALTLGYLDEVPLERIRRFEEDFYEYLDTNYESLLEEIRTTGQLPESSIVEEAIESFVEIQV